MYILTKLLTILQQFCHGGDTFIDWKVCLHTSWTSNLFTSVASVQTDQVADTDESLLHCQQATSTIHDPSSFGRDYFGGLLRGICWTEDVRHSAYLPNYIY